MFEWFSEQSKEVQVNIITSLTTIIVIIFTIILKEYFINIFKKKTEEKNIQLKISKSYSYPIVRSAEKLVFRLNEILTQRSSFLLSKNTINVFYNYKFNSTIYRLCVLMAWIRAINIEFTFYDSFNKNIFKEIDKAINDFQGALADGNPVEIKILNNVANILCLNISKLDKVEKENMAIALEDVLYNKLISKSALSSLDLAQKDQLSLLKSISNKFCEKLNHEKLDDKVIIDNLDKLIKEISIVESYIYREWQEAIGDIFILKSDRQFRKYDVLGYGVYEEIIVSKSDNYKWIEKVEKLFRNLNIDNDSAYDYRIVQIKKIYNSCLELIEVFSHFSPNKSSISLKKIELTS